VIVDNRAWYRKYQPKTMEELIFPNILNGQEMAPEEIKAKFIKMANDGFVPGNILSYGPGGFGKSSLTDILKASLLKEAKDFFPLGKGVNAVEELTRWLVPGKGKSSQRIVLIEEADKLSPQAQVMLKDGLMEKYQHNTTFIANTNRVEGIDKALRTRFNFQLNFKEIQPETAFGYLISVLDKEGVQYDRDKVWEFTYNNISKGLRDLINNLEINVTEVDGVKKLGGISDFKSSSNNEEYIIELIEYVIGMVESYDLQKINSILASIDNDKTIAPYYRGALDVTKNDPNLDYDFIFNKLLESNFNLDIKNIIMEQYQDIDLKKFPNLHFVTTINKCFLEIAKRKGL
jgi:DNA polymerase III delta prime subunit